MMGSVLSILDPLEPMTALAGDRRLHMTTNLLAGPGKHLDHYLHHPLRAWSWNASSRNAQLADARRAQQQQQVRSGEQTSRRPSAEVFACSPAVKSSSSATSRRAAHAQDESAAAAAAAAVAQSSVKLRAQERLQLQRTVKVQRAEEGHPDDDDSAGDPAASRQEEQQQPPPATRLQQHKDQQQQRNKGTSSGHEIVAGAAAAAQAATTMSNKTQQQQMKTITTQVACSANIDQQRGQHHHQQQQQQHLHHHHQLNQTSATSAANASVQNNPNYQTQQTTTLQNLNHQLSPPTTLADQASNQQSGKLSTKRAQQQQEADHQQSDADESKTAAVKMTQSQTIISQQQQQIYAHEHQKNLVKVHKHHHQTNNNNNHNNNNNNNQNNNKRQANQKQRDSVCNLNQPTQASRATSNNTKNNNNNNNNSRRQQQQPTGTGKGRKRSNQQVNGAHKSAAKAPNGQQQQQQQQVMQPQQQQQQWHRDHRSLSTSSSLGSSGSSSPSSSMLQIFSPRELQRQRHRRNQQQQQQSRHNNNQHPHMSRPNSSSASSTISSLSTAGGCEPKPMILCPSPQQQQQPSFMQQVSLPVDNQQRGAALYALAGQQPQLVLCPGLGDVWQPSAPAFYPAPPPRPWLQQQQRQTISPTSPPQPSTKPSTVREPEFTVISYNVLCDRMVSNEMFPSSPDIALDWFYRRELILRQLLEFNADIIALQELELEQFETYFRPELSHFGSYEAIFEPKSRARTMDHQKRKRVDGCAIFYKSHKFRLIQRHLLEFNQIAMANAQGSEAMLNRVMTKDNIGLAAVLEFIPPLASDGSLDSGADDDEDTVNNNTTTNANNKCPASSQQLNKLPAAKRNLQRAASHFERNYHQASGLLEHTAGSAHHQRLLVCTTHIHWDPEHCDVKLVQTIMLMNELECIARHYATCDPLPPAAPIVIKNHHLDLDPRLTEPKNNNKLFGSTQPAPILPLVLLGDFNSMPNSGVASYLTAGKINSLHKDFKSFRYTNCSNALALQHQYWNHYHNSGDTNNNTRSSGSSSSSSNSLSPSHLINANFRRQSSPAWCLYPTNNNNNNNKELSTSSSISSSYSTSSSSPYSSSPPTSSSSPITQQQQTQQYQNNSNNNNNSNNKREAPRDIAESQTKASPAHQQQHQAKQILNYNHPFNLVSAYEKDTMPYTNYTDKFKGIIDYIFYSSDSIQSLGLLGPLDKNWVKGNRIKGFPQPHLPSDHLPLLVKLRLTAQPEAGTSLIEQWPMQTSTSATNSSSSCASFRPSDLSHDPYDDHVIITKPQYNNHHHTNHPHQQQPQITSDHHDYLLGRVRQRQQPQLCKSQTVRVNTKNSRVKHEQIRS